MTAIGDCRQGTGGPVLSHCRSLATTGGAAFGSRRGNRRQIDASRSSCAARLVIDETSHRWNLAHPTSIRCAPADNAPEDQLDLARPSTEDAAALPTAFRRRVRRALLLRSSERRINQLAGELNSAPRVKHHGPRRKCGASNFSTGPRAGHTPRRPPATSGHKSQQNIARESNEDDHLVCASSHSSYLCRVGAGGDCSSKLARRCSLRCTQEEPLRRARGR